MNKNKGFTLIELLVVIAIIVILAMIVFPGVRTATDKAKDARIISELSQIRTQAEIFYTTNGTYTGMAADTNVKKLLDDISAQSKTTVTPTISSDGSKYRVDVTLTTTGAGHACIDSDSTTYTGTVALPAGEVCPTP